MPVASDPKLAFALRRPFAEQVAFFRGKLGNQVPTATWRDLWKSQHDRAFMVAGAAKADLLADLAGAVDAAIAQGETLAQFRKRFKQIVSDRGWHGWTGEGSKAGETWRTRVIYETNLLASYSAGRLAQLKAGGYRYWMYKHSDSVRHPRPHHQALNGVVRPADDAFWQTHYPPNGWGCRCRAVGVDGPASAKRLGGDMNKPLPEGWNDINPKTGEPVGIDKGWGYRPGDTVSDTVRSLAGKLDTLPPPLAAEVKAAMEDVSLPADLRDMNRQVLDRASRDDHGIEYAGLIGRDGKPLWVKRGQRSAVSFTQAEVAQMRGGVLTHNHPSSRSLSVADLRLAQHAGLRRVYAVGADGSIYAARVPDGVTEEAISSASARAEREIRNWIMGRIKAGEISIADAERYHHHAVNLLMARRGLIRYHASLAGKTPPWVYDAVRSSAS